MRNFVVFDNHSPNIHLCLCFVWTAPRERNYFRVGHMGNRLEDLHILRQLGVQGISGKASILFSNIWQHPISGWTKANTNGSFSESDNRSGPGGIFRNMRGILLEALHSQLAMTLLMSQNYKQPSSPFKKLGKGVGGIFC